MKKVTELFIIWVRLHLVSVGRAIFVIHKNKFEKSASTVVSVGRAIFYYIFKKK